jgi:predicted metal-dependent phosphotriesterase family hydrolase
MLVERAHAMGIRRIIMTHPLFQATELDPETSPTVGDALREFFDEFRKRGVKEDGIVQMAVPNPNRLLFDAMT